MKVPIHTVEWQHYPTKPCNDLRSWIDPATLQQTSFIEYYQVFSDKNGFVGGCSALDILFNCGPEAPQLFEKTFNQLFYSRDPLDFYISILCIFKIFNLN